VQAAWWQEKQDKVVDRSRCRVAAHDQSLRAGFAAVHHKTGRVTWLNHKTKTGGSAGGDGIWVYRMDLPGPTAAVGTRTDYSVGPRDYLACATRHLMA
jgi:hypothetical protein